MLLLAGEPGIGKTRLCGETARLAKAEHFDLLIGHCLESTTPLPFGPLREMLATLVARRSAEEIAAIAGPYASSLSMLLAGFAATNEPSDMALDRFSLYSALGSIFRSLSSSAPLLLIIEDLHWADSATLDFFNWLIRNESGRSIRLLATYRPEDAGDELEHCLAGLERERCLEELSLGSLDTRDLDRMLQATFGLDRPVPADLLHLLMSHTEGNPFFVEEILRSLAITRGDIASAGKDASRSMISIDAPRSVQDAVRLRTSRLGSTARHVLELAAVSGRHFDFDSIRELANLDELAMISALSELVNANLIVEETAETFVFRHALTRQAVYNELLARQRRTIHRQLAAQFKQRFESGDSMVLTDLAEQAYAGGEWADAIEYGDLAGRRAMELFAPRTAIDHFSRAAHAAEQLGRVPDPLLMMRRGTAHETVGEFDRALHDYEMTCDLARRAGNVWAEVDALLNLGLLWASNDYSRAGAVLERALDVARGHIDRTLEASCLNRIGNWHLNCERPSEALHCHERALALLQIDGDARTIAETLDLLGVTALFGGDATHGSTYLQQATEHWLKLGDKRGHASSNIMLSMLAPTYHSDLVPSIASHEHARVPLEAGLALARDIDWRTGECWGLWMLGGMNLAAEGTYERAFSILEEARYIAEETGHRQWLAAIHCMLGNTFDDLLQFPIATQHFERALTFAPASDSPYWHRSATAWLVSSLVRSGDVSAADQLLAESNHDDVGMNTPAQRLVWRAKAEIARASGRPGEALEIAERLAASIPSRPDVRPAARVDLLRGGALAALQRFEEAVSTLERARFTAEMFGTRPVVWRCELELGNLYLSMSRQEDAARHFAAVVDLTNQLSAGIADQTLRAAFTRSIQERLPAGYRTASRKRSKLNDHELTARERDVALLLTRGLSNREIAAELFIADWTVATHVRNILAKLDMTSRTQIAAWAIASGLRNEPGS